MSDCPKCGCKLNPGIFHDYCPVCEGGIVGVGSRKDLCARIAALEAKLQKQVERREEERLRAVLAEAERDKAKAILDGNFSEYQDMGMRLEQAEAELAALRAQRCDNCARYHEYNVHHNATCDEGVEVGYRVDGHNPPCNFDCNRWAERSEA